MLGMDPITFGSLVLKARMRWTVCLSLVEDDAEHVCST